MKEKRSSGFTLIELLVVIAIIAILAAILFPVFAQAREKARAITCLSNQKQIGLAVYQYLQDFDEVYPMDQLFVGDDPNNHVDWAQMIQPYVKNGDTDPNNHNYATGTGGTFSCPSFPTRTQSHQFGLHNYLCPDGAASWNNYTVPKTIAMAALDAPSNTIFAVDKGQGPFSWGWGIFETGEWAWTDWAGNPPGQNTSPAHNDLAYDYDMSITNSWDGSWPNPNVMPRYRHQMTANCIFADGHAKAMHKGSIDWAKNVYIPGMQVW